MGSKVALNKTFIFLASTTLTGKSSNIEPN